MLQDIPQNWRYALNNCVDCNGWTDAIDEVHAFLQTECAGQHRYHPRGRNIFKAFYKTRFNDVRAVIIGQDPYPCKKNATGVAFSTPIGRPMTKSVAMIYCAIATDLSGKIPVHGNLDYWMQQGVFLLNRVLTYRLKPPRNNRRNAKKENIHSNEGWEKFTQFVVQALAKREIPMHFILWGEDAQKIKLPNDYPKYLIHKAPHPAAPLSKDFEKFRTRRHFFAIDKEMKKNARAGEGEVPIIWLPE